MLTVLNKIGTAVFEPFWVFLCLGIAVGIFQLRKESRSRSLILFAIGCVLFMLCGRIVVHIGAARYALALIVPMVLFSAAFFRCREISPLIRGVFGLVLVGLLVGKDLRFNRYDDFRQQTINVIAADMSSFVRPDIWTFCGEATRFAYYGNFSKVASMPILSDRKKLSDFLMRSLKNGGIDHDSIYILCTEEKDSPPIAAEEVGLDSKHWRLLSRRFHDNRQRKYLSLYRATVPPESFHPNSSPPELSAWLKQTEPYLLPNGEFESATTEREFQAVKHIFEGKKANTFFPESKEAWPANWLPHNGYNANAGIVVKLTQKDPISGNQSLFMRSGSTISVISMPVVITGDRYLGFVVKGNPGTEFLVTCRYFSANGSPVWEDDTLFYVDSPMPRIYQIPIPSPYENKNVKFRLDFYLKQGELLLDHCCIYSTQLEINKYDS